MVLSIDGSDVYTTITAQDVDTRCLGLRSNSLAVLGTPVRQVGGKDRCLYVGQREMAVVAPWDNLNMIGSADATTCHIVIIRDIHTGVTGFAHLDTHKPEDFLTLEKEISKRLRFASSTRINLLDRTFSGRILRPRLLNTI